MRNAAELHRGRQIFKLNFVNADKAQLNLAERHLVVTTDLETKGNHNLFVYTE